LQYLHTVALVHDEQPASVHAVQVVSDARKNPVWHLVHFATSSQITQFVTVQAPQVLAVESNF
jgi:hypothetical protein